MDVTFFDRAIETLPRERLLEIQQAVDEFRVTVSRHREMARVSIEIECQDGADGVAEAAAASAGFEASLGLRPEVTAVPRGTLPRFELKAQRFIVQ